MASYLGRLSPIALVLFHNVLDTHAIESKTVPERNNTRQPGGTDVEHKWRDIKEMHACKFDEITNLMIPSALYRSNFPALPGARLMQP